MTGPVGREAHCAPGGPPRQARLLRLPDRTAGDTVSQRSQPAEVTMRAFERGGKTKATWGIELAGKKVTTTAGRPGTKGRTQTKEFASAAQARKEHDRLIAEKLAEGYVEAGVVVAGGAAAERQALEEALAEGPDDLAAHGAYADWLAEHGDARGELMQVQLALERPGLSAKRK